MVHRYPHAPVPPSSGNLRHGQILGQVMVIRRSAGEVRQNEVIKGSVHLMIDRFLGVQTIIFSIYRNIFDRTFAVGSICVMLKSSRVSLTFTSCRTAMILVLALLE